MDKSVRESLDNLGSTDDTIRLNALQTILKITEEKVDWAYDVWNGLIERLDHQNSYQRSIAIMLLCNLSKSDYENRTRGSLNRLLAHTKDEKFITSRQCIQNIWKVAVADDQSGEVIIAHLEKRFEGCADEKHYNLIRQDIIQSMRLIYDAKKNDRLFARAMDLVKIEKEEKYRKKYETILSAD
jgi:hypothetical protein